MSVVEWLVLILILVVLGVLAYYSRDLTVHSPKRQGDIDAAKEAAKRADKQVRG